MPHFDPTITVGSLLTILTLIGMALGMWYRAGRYIERWGATLQAAEQENRYLHNIADRRLDQLEKSVEGQLRWSQSAHEDNQSAAVRMERSLERISTILTGHEKRLDNFERE